MAVQPGIRFDNTYFDQLKGLYVPWKGENVPQPAIVRFNLQLALELGLNAKALDSDEGAAFFAGSTLPHGAAPLAQVYAGHQFGGFSPQLGDGRALLVGEIIDRAGNRRDIHLKGSGRTPFSRGGDGKAVLGPVLREYLMAEAMHALGVPTTRALAAVTTGEQIMRESAQPGAVLARVASSHLRVGTFQFFAARGEMENLQLLANYTIRRHFPELENAENQYLKLLRVVIDRQARLIARWMAVGFVHGVMNTDNMTISGETIDYGPCAFIDHYDPKAVFSSIDHQGRYAYGNQPLIAQWNLARFAETLLALIGPDDSDNAVRLATLEIDAVPSLYRKYWLKEMRAKLGLLKHEENDLRLVDELYAANDGQHVDFTLLFRRLADVLRGQADPLRALFDDPSAIDDWLENWLVRLTRENRESSEIAGHMDKVNPVYIPRNHLVEEAIEAAIKEADFGPFDNLLNVLSNPYENRDGQEAYETPAPEDFGKYTTYCGT